ncbi:MAG: polysaccharide deacetylase family protein [Caldilineaceae bacterium]
MPTHPKPIASLSLDLDNKWSYMKTHGEAGWETFPSYLDIFIPRVLEFLQQRDLRITFFIVGQDAALAQHHALLRSITAAGHEVGNHSFHHEPWLHLYSEAQIEEELARAEEQILAVTGQRPRGFRGPGYSFSGAVLRVLQRRGYHYDASTFPTYLGPLARMYYFMTAKLTPEEKAERKKLFGTMSEGHRPLHAYHWQLAGNEPTGLLEIPVTTMPLFKIPIHFSYLLYMSLYSPALAMLYFRAALQLCRWTGVQPSLLIHPLDFLGGDDVPALDFFPAMRMTGAQKAAIMDRALQLVTTYFTPVTMGEHAAAIQLSTQALPQLVLS